MLLMKAVDHLEEMKLKGNQIKWQRSVVICLLAISGILKSTIAAADHPGLEGVAVEGQCGLEAVFVPLLAAADRPGLQEGVCVEGQGGQEAVAAPPARGGMTIATQEEEEEEMMIMRRREKGKQAIVHEEGESSESKEDGEEEAKKKTEEEEEEAKKEEQQQEEEEEENEGAELTTLRIDVGQVNTITGVIAPTSTTTNGATGRMRVTWLNTVTIIGDDEDTAVAVEEANGLSNGEVEVWNV